jgi:hypothetical protein
MPLALKIIVAVLAPFSLWAAWSLWNDPFRRAKRDANNSHIGHR